MSEKGKVILVGAGPGDPGLITVRGLEAIAAADVLIYDYLANPELLAAARRDAEKIYVGKKGAAHTLEQDKINQLLFSKASEGGLVVRLKGGDPYVFGRGAEEMSFLVERGIEVEVVPGIPAAIGASAYAGIPLTDRRYTSTLAFVTGHEDPAKPESSVDWAHVANGMGTIVFYMGIKNLPEITRKLIENGLPETTAVSVVEWATMPNQRVITGTLATISGAVEKAGVKPPALTIVGGVNELRGNLNWFEKRPLFGKTIVVTRSRMQASALVKRLRELGAATIEMPTIEFAPPADTDELDSAVRRVAEYDWVIFTSVNGVDFFMARLRAAGGDARALAGVKIASIGPATTLHLLSSGINPDYQPEKYVAEYIFDGLKKMGAVEEKKFLLPRADIAREALPRLLREAGAAVDEVAAYRTIPGSFDPNALRKRIEDGGIDAVTFTSSSTAQYFFERIGGEFIINNKEKFAGISIGPVTSGTMRELGLPPAAESGVHTIPGLVDTILDYFGRKGSGGK
jgi:uroporphyrinogen III methyltransferase / synthase